MAFKALRFGTILNELKAVTKPLLVINLSCVETDFEMKNLFIFIFFIIAFVLIFVRSASKQTVDDIIDQYINARGGLDKLRSVQSIIMQGSREMMNNKVEVKITKVQGRLFRADFVFEENAGYTIITPNEGWISMPMRSAEPQTIPVNFLRSAKLELDIAGPLVDYKLKGYRAALLGRETISGKECHKIQLIAANGKESFYFIDIKTRLLVQSRYEVESNTKETREIVTSFSDYTNVDGILFPQTIGTEGNGIAHGSVMFERIEVNVGVEEKLYGV